MTTCADMSWKDVDCNAIACRDSLMIGAVDHKDLLYYSAMQHTRYITGTEEPPKEDTL